MFGLMRSCGCSQTREQRILHRIHYCGTCKTSGNLYGQLSRVTLNSDAVFLGELLSALSNPPADPLQWKDVVDNGSCGSWIRQGRELPVSIQFAATAGLVIADMKIADHMADSNRYLWKLPRKLFSGVFRAASLRLLSWGFPLLELWECWCRQAEREAEMSRRQTSRSAIEALDYLSEPTATATGLFFRHGALLVGCAELQAPMEALGRAFGALIYLLDAVEDFESDAQGKRFNALRAAFGLDAPVLPTALGEWAVHRLRDLCIEIEQDLHRLPIAPDLATQYAQRLKTNLSRRLQRRRSTGIRAAVGLTLAHPSAPFEVLHSANMSGHGNAARIGSSAGSPFRRRLRTAIETGSRVITAVMEKRPVLSALTRPAHSLPSDARIVFSPGRAAVLASSPYNAFPSLFSDFPDIDPIGDTPGIDTPQGKQRRCFRECSLCDWCDCCDCPDCCDCAWGCDSCSCCDGCDCCSGCDC